MCQSRCRPSFWSVPGSRSSPPPSRPRLPAANPSRRSVSLQLAGSVAIEGSPPIVARLAATLLVSESTWRLLVAFDGTGPSILGGLAQLGKLFGLDAGDLRAPPALAGFETFALDEIEVWVNGSPTRLEGIGAVAATIRSEKVWHPPIPFLTVTKVGTRWLMSPITIAGETHTAVAGSVFGSLVFQNASGEEPGIVDVSGELPSFVIQGEQREGTSINLVAAFDQLLGRAVPTPATDPPDPKITMLNLYADPFSQIFQAGATLEVKWPIPFFAGLSITQLRFEVLATQSSLSGAIAGRIQFGAQGLQAEARAWHRPAAAAATTTATSPLAARRGAGAGDGRLDLLRGAGARRAANARAAARSDRYPRSRGVRRRADRSPRRQHRHPR